MVAPYPVYEKEYDDPIAAAEYDQIIAAVKASRSILERLWNQRNRKE